MWNIDCRTQVLTVTGAPTTALGGDAEIAKSECLRFFSRLPFEAFPSHVCSSVLRKPLPSSGQEAIETLVKEGADLYEGRAAYEAVVASPGLLMDLFERIWWDELALVRIAETTSWHPAPPRSVRTDWCSNTSEKGFLKRRDTSCFARFDFVLCQPFSFMCFIDARRQDLGALSRYLSAFAKLQEGMRS